VLSNFAIYVNLRRYTTGPVKVIKRLDLAFSTVEIKKPEFDSEEYGLPSLSYVPRQGVIENKLSTDHRPSR